MATKASTKAERKPRKTAEERKRQGETRSAAGGAAKDALELLEQDHRRVEDLFDEFDEEDDEKRRRALAQEICRELTIHTQLEEEVFYPRAREATGDDQLIDEAYVEHDGVKHLIAEIGEMKKGEGLFVARVRVLEEMVKRHIQEEEEELFPELASAGMDIAGVGQELAARKQELMAEIPD
jgi:hemerythrin superfamily protein